MDSNGKANSQISIRRNTYIVIGKTKFTLRVLGDRIIRTDKNEHV